MYYYCEDNAYNTDFLQNTCFKEINDMAVKQTNKLQTFMKKDIFQLSYGIKNIHRSKLHQWHTHWEKGYFQRSVSCFFSDKVENV